MKRLFLITILIMFFAGTAFAGSGLSVWEKLAGAVDDGDYIAATDVSDTTQSAEGSSVAMTAAQLKTYVLAGGAAAITVEDTGGNFTASQVEAVLAEIATILGTKYQSGDSPTFNNVTITGDLSMPGVDTYRGVTLTENSLDTNVSNQTINYTNNVVQWKNESGIEQPFAFAIGTSNIFLLESDSCAGETPTLGVLCFEH